MDRCRLPLLPLLPAAEGELAAAEVADVDVVIDFLTSPCRDLDRLRSLRSFIRSEAGVPDRANVLLHRASLSSKVILLPTLPLLLLLRAADDERGDDEVVSFSRTGMVCVV